MDYEIMMNNNLKIGMEAPDFDAVSTMGDIAVLENRDTGEMLNVSKKDLPQDAKEGTILKLNKDKYEIDLDEQKIVADRIKNKMKNLWK